MTKASIELRRVTMTAICVGIALALKISFSFYIPLFGENGMQVGISGIFSMLPSFLFGPIYGAVASGLSDLLGYMLKPTGAYLPQMTLCMAAGGFLRGMIWLYLKGKRRGSIYIAVLVSSVLLLVFGIVSMWQLSLDGVNASFYAANPPDQLNLENLRPISRMIVSRTASMKDPVQGLNAQRVFFTYVPMASALLGLLLLGMEMLLRRVFAKKDIHVPVLQLLIAAVLSGLFVTTINTVILREIVYQSWKLIPFPALWTPRALEEVLGNAVKVFFIAALLGVLEGQPRLKQTLY